MDAKYLAEIKARDSETIPDIAAPVFREQIATLKKALELACERIERNETSCGISVQSSKKETLINALLQQAQEQGGDLPDGRTSPENKPLEGENFIQTKYGYCFYTLNSDPLIYNLYVHPQYRRRDHSRELLEIAIATIRKSGCAGEIRIQAEPRENSIGLEDLAKYYKRMGLVVCKVRKSQKEI